MEIYMEMQKKKTNCSQDSFEKEKPSWMTIVSKITIKSRQSRQYSISTGVDIRTTTTT